jgi:hypothetical protein
MLTSEVGYKRTITVGIFRTAGGEIAQQRRLLTMREASNSKLNEATMLKLKFKL